MSIPYKTNYEPQLGGVSYTPNDFPTTPYINPAPLYNILIDSVEVIYLRKVIEDLLNIIKQLTENKE